ncbi:hypothetical protein [Streptomyces lavendulae]|uniref:hypothetical protein n=1 Tax=Streptomyces lavendulae TaxID=1914 RepID=UPI003825C731
MINKSKVLVVCAAAALASMVAAAPAQAAASRSLVAATAGGAMSASAARTPDASRAQIAYVDPPRATRCYIGLASDMVWEQATRGPLDWVVKVYRGDVEIKEEEFLGEFPWPPGHHYTPFAIDLTDVPEAVPGDYRFVGHATFPDGEQVEFSSPARYIEFSSSCGHGG